MKRFFFALLFLAVFALAVAQIGGKAGSKEHTINVPNPTVYMDIQKPGQHPIQPGQYWPGESIRCPDINDPLLAILTELTDQDSVKNELKFEQDSNLTADQILQRRMKVIASGITALRATKGAK